MKSTDHLTMKTAIVLIFCFTISLSNMQSLQEHKEKTEYGTPFVSYPPGPKEYWATNEGSNSADYQTADFPKSNDPEAGRPIQAKRKDSTRDTLKDKGWQDMEFIINKMKAEFSKFIYELFERIRRVHSKCYKDAKPWPTCSHLSQPDKKSLSEALTDLGFSTYKTILQLSKEDNFVFSPLSIVTVLSHFLLGARGETKEQLEKGLKYPKDFICVHKALKEILNSRSSFSASQIFIQPDVKLHDFFLNQSYTYYGVTPQKLTSDTAENVRMINDWISEHTGHKITELVDNVSPDVRLILLNAVYFHSKWKTVFDKSETRNKAFFISKNQKITVPTMTSQNYDLASTTNYSLRAKIGRFRLFGNSSLIIILPQSTSQKLSDLEEKLTFPVFMDMINKLQKTSFKETIVSLPKFKVDFKQDLMSVMEHLGIKEIISRPNLCGMSNQEELLITDAKHRAVLELNEEGVEAAAASSITLSRTASFFEVNQPFLLIIWDDQLAYPIFIGRVQDPSSKA